VRLQHDNHIDYSFGAVFAWRRGLGILSLARLVRLQHEPGELGSQEKLDTAMATTAILHEAQRLHNVSDRLDSLAEQHPLVSEALITISGSVRNTATLLEVLVVTKMPSLPGLDPASA
jgi:hypothetical protein